MKENTKHKEYLNVEGDPTLSIYVCVRTNTDKGSRVEVKPSRESFYSKVKLETCQLSSKICERF